MLVPRGLWNAWNAEHANRLPDLHDSSNWFVAYGGMHGFSYSTLWLVEYMECRSAMIAVGAYGMHGMLYYTCMALVSTLWNMLNSYLHRMQNAVYINLYMHPWALISTRGFAWNAKHANRLHDIACSISFMACGMQKPHK